MKIIICFMSIFIALLSYIQYQQEKQILVLLDYVATTVPLVLENMERLDEHAALLKQLMGVDYEEKEKYLFNF